MNKLLLGATTGLIALAAIAMPPSALAARTETRTYVAAGGDANVLDLSGEVPGGPGIGGGIFELRSGEGKVTVTVNDAAAGANVSWYFQFSDDDPLTDSTDFGDVCMTKSKTLTIPAGKGYTKLAIFVDQTWQVLACDAPTKGVPATTGNIVASFAA